MYWEKKVVVPHHLFSKYLQSSRKEKIMAEAYKLL